MRNRSFAFQVILIILAALIGSAQAGGAQNLYRNKDYAFSILFPTGWQQKAGQTPSTVVVSKNQEGDSIIIQVRQLPQNVTLDEFPDSELQAVIIDAYNELKRRFSDATLQDSGITHISNRKAIWMLYSYSIKEAFATIKVTTMYYQVWHEGKLYGILCSAPSGRYDLVSSTLLNSVRSFIFEDRSWYRK
ncbi:MAG: PsbP-related protein [Bacteroidota bacterium]|nr:PsbP-related protein [Bacteroidota bacterium]